MADQVICSTHNVLNDSCLCTSKLNKLGGPSHPSPFSLCSNLFFYLFIFGFLSSQLFLYYRDSEQSSEISDLNRRYIDKIDENNLIDFASASAGGKIVKEKSSYSLKQNPIDLLISDNNSPGQCWGFEGHIGWAYIELPQTILLNSFEVIHLNSLDYSSAPKNFQLSGVEKNGQLNKIYSGSLDMTIKSESRKTSFLFKASEVLSYSIILLNITSNHGGKQTCVYQLKVHGQPAN